VNSCPAQGAPPASLSGPEFGPLLKTVSRSFYLSLRFLPECLREPLGLAYLLARTSDTVADASEAPLGARLEALEALIGALQTACKTGRSPCELETVFAQMGCSNPAEARLLKTADALVGCFAVLPAPLRAEVFSVLQTITAGQRGDLLRFGYASASAPQALLRAADTVAYTYAVAGCVGEFWTRICALQMPGFSRIPVAELLDHGRRLGQGLQLVNILRDLPQDLRMGRCYLPAEELEAVGLSPADLLEHPVHARPLFERWVAQAEEWLAAGEAYVAGIRGRRLRFSVALPRLLGTETLALLRRNPPLETTQRIRVSRGTVARCALKAFQL
jgi:farnesyl-diphosphate farnesyltransferase